MVIDYNTLKKTAFMMIMNQHEQLVDIRQQIRQMMQDMERLSQQIDGLIGQQDEIIRENLIRELILYFDGSADPNPGMGGAGAVLYTMGDPMGERCFEVATRIKYCTNNEAEYQALISGLRMVLQFIPSARRLIIRGDSQLVIRQLKGEYRVGSANLRSLYDMVRQIEEELRVSHRVDVIEYEWVERGRNERADRLSRLDTFDPHQVL
jgi:ribonuclease HI